MRTLAMLIVSAAMAVGCQHQSTGDAPASVGESAPSDTPSAGVLGHGEGSMVAAGCLAAAPQEQKAKGVPATRSEPPAESVSVQKEDGGLQIVHSFRHPCCLTPEAQVSVDGTAVTVVEKLSGVPCRCLCDSTLKTRVGLEPGDYAVKVMLALPDQTPREVHAEKVTLAAPSGRK